MGTAAVDCIATKCGGPCEARKEYKSRRKEAWGEAGEEEGVYARAAENSRLPEVADGRRRRDALGSTRQMPKVAGGDKR